MEKIYEEYKSFIEKMNDMELIRFIEMHNNDDIFYSILNQSEYSNIGHHALSELREYIINLIKKELETRQFKDLLILYEGGLYDGCFWEYNAFFIDSNGEYFNIYSTGKKGIPEPNKLTLYDLLVEKSNPLDIIDLRNDVEVSTMTRTQNTDLVIKCTSIINRHYENKFNKSPMIIYCDECGTLIDNTIDENVDSLYLVDMKWEGGLVYSANRIICENCYMEHYNEDDDDYE